MLDFLLENQFVILFFSAFLSSTILPGNSEAVLAGYASQLSPENQLDTIITLWIIATIGNGLGSLTTYGLARLFPKPEASENQGKVKKWAIHSIEKYGVWSMVFSWLPVVGDVLCGVAGWYRLPIIPVSILIFLGKAIRYAIIMWSVIMVVS